MKIKVKEKSYKEVLSLIEDKHQKPIKQSAFFGWLLKKVSEKELRQVGFTYKKIGMEALKEDQPCLYLMNHSSFIDLKLAATIIYPRRFNTICTSDGFVGKALLMRLIGCIPTKKFIPDITLLKDMEYALSRLKSSVLLFPEASYSFDGTATSLPESLGRCIKSLKVPVVMIKTYGAFSRDPLYNSLKLRDVKVSADEKYLLSPEQIAELSSSDINAVLKEEFSFDNFKWQQENKIKISESFRADDLNRVLYKCPRCNSEGKTIGHGVSLTCTGCGAEYILDEYGYMYSTNGNTEYHHIPDWFAWQRECVKNEISSGQYKLEAEVDIYVLADTKAIYKVGDGVLTHTADGFSLTGCNAELQYKQSPLYSYSLYADYFWYEIGDMISIGNNRIVYYCFPKDKSIIVAKARLAAEELYKLSRAKRRRAKPQVAVEA